MEQGGRGGFSPVILFIVIFVAEIIVTFFFVPNQWLDQIAVKEYSLLVEEMGRPTGKWVVTKGGEWYVNLFVETGLDDDYWNDDTAPQTGFGATEAGSWLQGRNRAFRTVMQQVLQRAALFYSWSLFVVFVAVPFVWDGAMQRKIKLCSFRHTSTASRAVAVGALGILPVALLMALFMPIPFHPGIIPVLMVLMVLSISVVISNTAKEL